MAQFTNQIIPINPAYSALIQESGKNSGGTSTFQCPPNTVITGRWHQGDENGDTQYQYCQLIPGALIVYYSDTFTSDKIQESGKDNDGTSSFICPENAVIVGRWHDGDENGDTQYRYAYLYYKGEKLLTKNPQWSDWIEESGKGTGGSSTFNCPPNTVIVGRQHQGDENGDTRYQYASVYLADSDQPLLLTRSTDIYTSASVKESSGTWVNAPENKVMTGRQHKGDENGQTTYEFSYLFVKLPNNELETIDAQWGSWIQESGKDNHGTSSFQCPENTVMVGRQHKGDENGDTRYLYAYVRLGQSANPCVVSDQTQSKSIKESSGTWAIAPNGEVMTGRSHSGDENGSTTYTYSFIQTEAMNVPTDKTINWMQGIEDNRLISQINIPGTHDSAAINSYVYTPYTNQGRSITDQLKSGVRMLDVRIQVYKESDGSFRFTTCHGAILNWAGRNTFQSFESLMDEVSAFLTEQSSETVLMSLKVDDWYNVPVNDPEALASLASFLNGYPVEAPSSLPTLGAIRSKIFLLNRINQSYNLGTPMDWPYNTPGSYDNYSNGQNGDIRHFNIYVQDRFRDVTGHEKLELFENTWEQYQSDELLMNFASATRYKILGLYMNEPLLTDLGQVEGAVRRPILGISLFDYGAYGYLLESGQLIDCVALTIDSNFAYRTYDEAYQIKSFDNDQPF